MSIRDFFQKHWHFFLYQPQTFEQLLIYEKWLVVQIKPILVQTSTGPEADVDLLLIVTFALYILGIHKDNREVIKSLNLYGGFVSLI